MRQTASAWIAVAKIITGQNQDILRNGQDARRRVSMIAQEKYATSPLSDRSKYANIIKIGADSTKISNAHFPERLLNTSDCEVTTTSLPDTVDILGKLLYHHRAGFRPPKWCQDRERSLLLVSRRTSELQFLNVPLQGQSPRSDKRQRQP